MIREALANAGLAPTDVDAVEAHGTGTMLGDPIEARGAARDLRPRAVQRPAVARVAEVATSATRRRRPASAASSRWSWRCGTSELPQTLHAEQASPHVDWDSGAVRAADRARARGRPATRVRRAAVSAFGISGTNAHVVLEEAPALDAAAPSPAPAPCRTRGRRRCRSSCRRPARPRSRRRPGGCASSSQARPELDAVRGRAVAGAGARAAGAPGGRARSRDRGARAAVARVRARRDRPGAGARRGAARGARRVRVPGPGRAVGGHGGRALGSPRRCSPSRCARAPRRSPRTSTSTLEAVLRGEPGQPSLEPIEVVQPVLFAIMVSLAALWRSFGVEPAAVVGHSQGEIAAAHIAGGLSLEDAARIVAVRSRALARIAGAGGMLAVAAAARRARSARRARGRAGDRRGGQRAPRRSSSPATRPRSTSSRAACEADGVDVRRILSTVAGHSPHVEAVREEVLDALAGVDAARQRHPAVLDRHRRAAGDRGDGRRALVSQPAPDRAVRAGGARAHAGRDVGALIEIGPHPVLAAPVHDILESEGTSAGVATIGSLRRDEGGLDRFVGSLAEAHVAGVHVDWEPLFARRRARPAADLRVPAAPLLAVGGRGPPGCPGARAGAGRASAAASDAPAGQRRRGRLDGPAVARPTTPGSPTTRCWARSSSRRPRSWSSPCTLPSRPTRR